VSQDLNRRDLLRTGLLLGTAAWLSGCQSGGGVTELPPKQWDWSDPLDDPSKAPPLAQNSYKPGTVPTPNAPIGPVPGVISRSQWTNAKPIMSREAYAMAGVARITVHHDALPSTGIRSMSDSARRLESVRQSHVRNGWVDIGYHYSIDPMGRVWEARPNNLQGAHVKNQNEHNLGVMLMGNFNEHAPTSDALNTLDAFLAEMMRRYRVPVGRVFTHQEIGPSACPGVRLQRYMVATRAPSGRLARA
jgi:hypothetical protein